MARFYGGDAPYILRMHRKSRRWKTGVELAMVLISGFAAGFLLDQLPKEITTGGRIILFGIFFIAVFGALSVLVILLRRLDISVSKYQRNLSGETAVADELKKLSDEYAVCQDLVVPRHGGNIDFVVVGPTGMYAIEVKSSKGEFRRQGMTIFRNGYLYHESNALEQSIRSSEAFHNWLKVHAMDLHIRPVLVFASPQASLHPEMRIVEGIDVLTLPELVKWITTNDSRLSGDFTPEEIGSVLLELHH